MTDILQTFFYLNTNYSYHYFKDECIVFTNCGRIYLNKLYIDVIVKCDGLRTGQEIWLDIVNKYVLNEDDNEVNMGFNRLLNELLSNNIIFNSIGKKPVIIKITGKMNKCYPRQITIELTNTCNFSCPHCFKDAGGAKCKFIDTQLLMNTFHSLSGLTEIVEITGGEATLHPKINDIIKKATQNFTTVCLLTNGSNITKVNEDILKKLRYIQVTLYGYDEKTYQKFTQNENSYYKVREGLKYIKKSNVYLIIAIGIDRDNYLILDKYINCAISNGANEIRFSLVQPLGRGADRNNQKKWIFSDDELIMLKDIIDKYADMHKEVNFRRLNSIFMKRIKDSYSFNCGAGKLSIAIGENGQVRACNIMPENFFGMGRINDYLNSIEEEAIFNFEEGIRNFEEDLNQRGFALDNIKCKGFCE